VYDCFAEFKMYVFVCFTPRCLFGILNSQTEYRTIYCLYFLVGALHFLRFRIFKNQQNSLIALQ